MHCSDIMDNLTACIFDIQKFCVHDGPGIRTTVFFKGCPLNCYWCSNPESQILKPQPMWDKIKCTMCGKCVLSCPNVAICANENIKIDFEKCKACGKCENTCSNGAIVVSGKTYSVKEALDICLQDKFFYDESGGGVTLSGGEVLRQYKFAGELLDALHEKGIHTALETTGFAAADVFAHLLPKADLILFDVKHYNSAKHINATGVSNEQIIKNLRMAVDLGTEIIVRIPVIPKFNDSVEDAAGLAELIKSVKAEKVQLLPFHQFGQKKYDMLGRDYKLPEVGGLYPEMLEEYRCVFERFGLECFF